ncbi:MAG: PAS domain S-box protein [Candidatus Krumholzibacteria bacterium]|nr:PAS domain S-box protein [Candidatus Krumholzibacteria bacterium]
MATVPLFVEDITLARQAIDNVIAGGVEDFELWLDAHPEFITLAVSLVRVVDVNKAVITLNAAANRQEMLNSLDRVVLPESLPGIKGVLKAIARGDEYFEGECQYRALDGRHYFTMNQAWIPSPDKPGDLLVFATIDITDLKQAQLDLTGSEERYRLLVETAHDVIIRHDLSGNVTFVNRAGLELTGYAEEDLVGRNVLDLVPPEFHEEIPERKKQRNGGSPGVSLYETVFLDGRGRRVSMEVSSTLIPGSITGGGEPQILLIARDISERKRVELEQQELEARLRDAQKLESLGVLAGGIAHDFNNLLVTIMGNTELVRGDIKGTSVNRNSLDAVLEAAGRAADLCRQMQAYAGSGKISVQPANLNQLILDIKRLLQVSVSKRSHLHFELADDLPSVKIDETQIRQVLMNLVTNAAESLGDEGGEIMVRTGVNVFEADDLKNVVNGSGMNPGRHVWCEVRDSGCGMETDVANRIFDPFFTTKFAGRGLGMSAALGIIKGHDGGFRMETGPTSGSTISFLLPAHQITAIPSRKRRRRSPETSEVNLAGKLILVVDDDPQVRAVGESFLRRLGCKVLLAADGFEAIRIFGERHHDINAVLLDFTMAGMDGMAAYRRLRVIRSDIPVILSSGYDSQEVEDKTSSFEVAGFVAKPYTLKMMREVLTGVLSKSED